MSIKEETNRFDEVRQSVDDLVEAMRDSVLESVITPHGFNKVMNSMQEAYSDLEKTFCAIQKKSKKD